MDEQAQGAQTAPDAAQELEPISYIDLNGVKYELVDEVARESISALSKDNHPVGSVYETTSAEDNPALNFGGTWELQEGHLFRGVYVYVRIA